MLDRMLKSAQPMIKGLIQQKCQEKLVNGEKTIIISINDLEKIMLDYLGVNFLNINIDNNAINLEIDEDLIHG